MDGYTVDNYATDDGTATNYAPDHTPDYVYNQTPDYSYTNGYAPDYVPYTGGYYTGTYYTYSLLPDGMLTQIFQDLMAILLSTIWDILRLVTPYALLILGAVIAIEFAKNFIQTQIGGMQARNAFIASPERRNANSDGIWDTDFDGNAVFCPHEEAETEAEEDDD